VLLSSLYLAAVPLAIWAYLLLARGTFWRVSEDALAPKRLEGWPPIVVVVPARNEAETIARSITSILKQDYRGDFEIVVADDQSHD
jgi:cellulose synthase/poly-beta-1,6-N-acetylglucosamine synthase-like glycosyltransferase